MKKSWKPSGGLVIGLRNKLKNDVFAAAQLKVVLLYFLMGVVILGAAGYLVYVRIVLIVKHLLNVAARLIASRSAVNAPATAALIGRSISQEIQGMDVGIALWLALVIVIAAVLFAGITLWPIGFTMEKQRRLIGNVSHELKTPLSVMKTNTEVTLMDVQALTEDSFSAALTANLEEIDQMSEVVKLLLNFSTLDSRLRRLVMSPVDLAAVARAAERSARPFAAEKNIALSLLIPIDPDHSHWMVQGDASAIEEMIVYILQNAFAYTPAYGSVTLSLTRDGGSIVLSAADTGGGIAKQDIPHVFEPFYQRMGATNSNKEANATFGLVIAKEIAAAHHAVVSIASETGKGTTFSVKLRRSG